VAVVTIRTIRRASRHGGGDGRYTEITGDIQVVGRTTVPAGSFKLRFLHQFDVLTSYTRNRAVQGSASGAVGANYPAAGNNAVIVPRFSGTTGTRLASIATLGSAVASGTTNFSFRAIGR